MDIKQFFADLHMPNTFIQIGEKNNVLAYSGGVDLISFLDENKNKDLYFMGNVSTDTPMRRANDNNIEKKSYVYFDFDIRKELPDITDDEIKNIATQWESILSASEYSKWHSIVFSGNGLHLYYVSDVIEVNREHYAAGYDLFRKDLWRLTGFEPDKSCSNLARIARVPGSYNNKNGNHKLVEIVASNTIDASFLSRMQEAGVKELERQEEIRFAEEAMREVMRDAGTYNKEEFFDAINDIPIELEILKDFPEWSYDNKKNFWLANGKIATSAYIQSSDKVNNVLMLSDTRWININKKGVGTYLYRREMSRWTNKETVNYFLKNYPSLEKFKKKDVVEPVVLDESEKKRKYSWGTEELNNNFALIKRGSYVIIVADQGSGKTTFALFQAMQNARMGNKVLYLSLEMDNDEIYDFLARESAGITVEEEYNDNIPERKMQVYHNKKKSLMELDNFSLAGVQKGTPTTMQFIKDQLDEHKPDMIYIDNFDLVDREADKEELVSQKQKSAQFMNIASTYQIPVIVLHHNRKRSSGQKKDASRTLDDVGGSGKITDDADRIVMLKRTPDEEDQMKNASLGLILAKARGYNTCSRTVYFDKGEFRDKFITDCFSFSNAKKVF